MKRFFFLAFLSILFVAIQHKGVSQPNFAVVSQDGQTNITNSIDDAIEQASDGDFIYLPPGNFDIGDLHIDKEVQLIGVGFYPKATTATGPTVLNGILRFMTGADGSSLQGVQMNGNIICGTDDTNCNVGNLVIRRCRILKTFYLSYGWDKKNTGSNVLITENVFESTFFGGDVENLVFSKNILIYPNSKNKVLSVIEDAIFENNIIITHENNPLDFIQNTIFRNNVIVGSRLVVNNQVDNVSFINNLCTNIDLGGSNNGGLEEGNVQMNRENIFVNQEGNTFSFEHDYHLTQDAIDAITGTDGTQVGIYGTNDPYKEYGIPPTPNIEYIKVSPSTQPDGKLKIEATVKAQQK